METEHGLTEYAGDTEGGAMSLEAQSPASFLQNREQENRTATTTGGVEGRKRRDIQMWPVNIWVTSHPHTGVLYYMCFMNSFAICNCQDSVHWAKKRSTYFNWEALAPVALPLLCLSSHTDQAFPSYLRSDENWSSCCERSLQNKTLEQSFIPNGVITYETRRAGEK